MIVFLLTGGGFYVQEKNLWHIQGIVSASFLSAGQCDVSKYAIFTEISSYSKWIKKKATDKTLKNVNRNVCSQIEDLYDEETYLKTLCIVSKDLNYDEAKVVCNSAGMELFVVNNLKVQNAIVAKAGSKHSDVEYTRWWINGQKTANGNWFTHSPEKMAIYDDLSWYGGSSSNGECLSIVRHSIKDKMAFNGWTCDGIAYGFCEFFK